jgi:hypothetical protein
VLEGGCLCGAVRFRTEAEPIVTRICWCRDCQKLAAGAGTVNVIVPVEGLSITGETADYVSKADSGNIMHRRFCPACGTPLFSAAEARPNLTVIRVGALDDPDAVTPAGTIWTASAPSWALIDDGLPLHEGQPPPVA